MDSSFLDFFDGLLLSIQVRTIIIICDILLFG